MPLTPPTPKAASRLMTATSIDENNEGGLEATELAYLKLIVQSYMMGTDRLTMAKVMLNLLKFNEQEKQKLIEHEKYRIF
jgi:hypothetical protein